MIINERATSIAAFFGFGLALSAYFLQLKSSEKRGRSPSCQEHGIASNLIDENTVKLLSLKGVSALWPVEVVFVYRTYLCILSLMFRAQSHPETS